MNKNELIETAKQVIDLKAQALKNKEDIEALDKKVEELKQSEMVERRRLENKIKRSIWEVIQITLGNRKQVEELSHRVDDTVERFDKIEQTMDWVMKTLIGLFITAIFGGVLAYLFSKF